MSSVFRIFQRAGNSVANVRLAVTGADEKREGTSSPESSPDGSNNPDSVRGVPSGAGEFLGLERRAMIRMGTLAALGAGGVAAGTALPAEAAVPSVARSISGKGAVMLSMDDGFLAMDTVRQMLDSRGQKGTFFITPGLLNGPTKINPDHIRSMASNGHEVGAHSQTHANLSKITQAQRAIEFELPKTYLGKIIGKPVTSFAYPFGTASGGRNAATDLELYLRYDRVFDTSQYNQPALHPRYSPPPTLIRRTCVDGVNHEQCLAMIREAASRPMIASLYFHNIDTPINPSLAQLTEMLDLAQALGVDLLTASEAFGSNRMVANAGFEDSGSSAYPWRWFKSGTGALAIVSEDPPVGLPGTRSLHLSTKDHSSYSEVSQAVEVVSGTTYSFSFRARAVAGPVWGTNNVHGSVVGLDYAQNIIAGSEVRTAPIMSTDKTWAKYTVDFTPSSACTTVLLGLSVDAPWGGATAAFDHAWFGPKCMADLG